LTEPPERDGSFTADEGNRIADESYEIGQSLPIAA
jgi:hypothetical protein